MECRPGSDWPITAAVSHSYVVSPVRETQKTLRHVTLRWTTYGMDVCDTMLHVVWHRWCPV